MSNTITICYTLHHDGDTIVHEVCLDPQTLEHRFDAPVPAPAWAALDFEKCSNCPLHAETHPQ